MIIDAHQHFLFPSRESYPWLRGESLRPLMQDFTPQMLETELKRNGVSKSVLVQTKSSLRETRAFLQTAVDTPFIAGVVGWVDLTDERVGETLDALIEGPGGNWLVGVRHQVQDEEDPAWLLREDVHRGLRALAKRQLKYDLLIQPRHLTAANEVVRRHPHLTFVVDHLANPNVQCGNLELWSRDLRPLATLPNTFMKLSGVVTQADWVDWEPRELVPYLRAALKLFGPNRCLFGSDWPVCLLAADYQQVLKLAEEACQGLETDERYEVFCGTATRAYRLDQQERLCR